MSSSPHRSFMAPIESHWQEAAALRETRLRTLQQMKSPAVPPDILPLHEQRTLQSLLNHFHVNPAQLPPVEASAAARTPPRTYVSATSLSIGGTGGGMECRPRTPVIAKAASDRRGIESSCAHHETPTRQIRRLRAARRRPRCLPPLMPVYDPPLACQEKPAPPEWLRAPQQQLSDELRSPVRPVARRVTTAAVAATQPTEETLPFRVPAASEEYAEWEPHSPPCRFRPITRSCHVLHKSKLVRLVSRLPTHSAPMTDVFDNMLPPPRRLRAKPVRHASPTKYDARSLTAVLPFTGEYALPPTSPPPPPPLRVGRPSRESGQEGEQEPPSSTFERDIEKAGSQQEQFNYLLAVQLFGIIGRLTDELRRVEADTVEMRAELADLKATTAAATAGKCGQVDEGLRMEVRLPLDVDMSGSSPPGTERQAAAGKRSIRELFGMRTSRAPNAPGTLLPSPLERLERVGLSPTQDPLIDVRPAGAVGAEQRTALQWDALYNCRDDSMVSVTDSESVQVTADILDSEDDSSRDPEGEESAATAAPCVPRSRMGSAVADRRGRDLESVYPNWRAMKSTKQPRVIQQTADCGGGRVRFDSTVHEQTFFKDAVPLKSLETKKPPPPLSPVMQRLGNSVRKCASRIGQSLNRRNGRKETPESEYESLDERVNRLVEESEQLCAGEDM